MVEYEDIIRMPKGDMYELQKEGTIMAKKILDEKLDKQRFVMIWDEVGLGKTYEALGLVFLQASEKEDSNILIVAPNEAIGKKWIEEYKNFKDKKYYIGKEELNIIDCLNNPLEIINNKDRKIGITNIYVIRANKFSYIDTILKANGDIDNEEDDDKVFLALKNKNEKLDSFDLVIIDESQNLRGEWAAKNRNFNVLFGLNRKFYKVKEYKTDMKFRKTVFLTATPYHSCKADLERQLSYIIRGDIKDNKHKIIKLESQDELEKIPKKELQKEENVYAIRRHRKFKGKNKYFFREYSAEKAEMNFEEMLTMALVTKQQIQTYGKQLKMGYVDSFESFITLEDDEENKNQNDKKVKTKSDYDNDGNVYREEIEDKEKKKREKELLKKLKNALEKGKLIDKDGVLAHPKTRKMKEILEENINKEDLEKELIFTRRISSTEEIKKIYSNVYDKKINGLVNEILDKKLEENERKKYADNKTGNYIKVIESKINQLNKNENKQDTGDDEKEYSVWLDSLKDKKTNSRKMFYIKVSFTKSGAFSTICEENLIDYLNINWSYNNNKKEVVLEDKKFTYKELEKEAEELVKNNNFMISNTNLKRDRIRILNLLLLNKYNEKNNPKYENISNWYEEFYFKNRRNVEDNEEQEKNNKKATSDSFNLSCDETLKNMKYNIWKKDLWNDENKKIEKFLLCDYDKITKEKFINREIIKKIIEKNIINGEGIIYLILMRINKGKEDNLENLLKNIKKDNSKFKERLSKRIRGFLDIFTNELSVRKILDINFSENENMNENLSKSMQIFYPSPVAACSSKTRPSISRVQKCFNTTFFPDVIVTTDVLKEGIDLQVDCSKIIHYGIAWTPGDMEQRIGRIDRYFSKVYRDYDENKGDKNKKLQVEFIYMENSLDEKQTANIINKMTKDIEYMEEKEIDLTGTDKNEKEETTFDASEYYESVENSIDTINKLVNDKKGEMY